MINSYQASIFVALKNGDSGELVGGRIAERATSGQVYPYIWLTSIENDWSSKTDDGLEVEVEVHIGSRYDGNKEADTIADAVYGDLHNKMLTSNTAQILLCQFSGSTMLYDPDGVTRHKVVKFKLLITEEE